MRYASLLERRIDARTATRSEWHTRRRLIRLGLYDTPHGELVLMCFVPAAMMRQAVEAWARSPEVRAAIRAVERITAR